MLIRLEARNPLIGLCVIHSTFASIFLYFCSSAVDYGVLIVLQGQGASMPNDVHPPGSHLRNERPVNTVGQQTNVRLSSDMSRESRAALERAVMQELEVRAASAGCAPFYS